MGSWDPARSWKHSWDVVTLPAIKVSYSFSRTLHGRHLHSTCTCILSTSLVNSHSWKAGLDRPGSFWPALWALGWSRLSFYTSTCDIDHLSLLLEVFTVVCLEPRILASTRDTSCRCWLHESRPKCLEPHLRALPNDPLPCKTEICTEIVKSYLL